MELAALGILALVFLASRGKKKPGGSKPGGGAKPNGGGAAADDPGAREAARQVAELEACIVTQSREIVDGKRDAYTCTAEQKTEAQKAAELRAQAKADADAKRRREQEAAEREAEVVRKRREAEQAAAEAKAKGEAARREAEARALETDRKRQEAEAELALQRKKDEAQRAAADAEKKRLEAERAAELEKRRREAERQKTLPPGYSEKAARQRAPELAAYLKGLTGNDRYNARVKGKVATWQKLAGLKSDGLYGKRTRRALMVLGVAAPPPVFFAQGEDEYSIAAAERGAYL